MAVTTHRRQPGGTPFGGRFAVAPRSESAPLGSDLADDPDLYLAGRDANAWAEATWRYPGHAPEPPDLPGDLLPNGRRVPEDAPPAIPA
ncbi:hypothetical protein BN13_280025 [Nostocoides jenkinsii Ben 74]|uniref:Uncharacterized protein n=1 Tax=Nostocoides jenkinsii Ben 74 TaxID=1193518 RepID=A0A077MDY2_9MICO|nr:hypothetical protein BN13_280025 [Tetrasphaera jenkinsii Ben 74]